MKNRLRLALMIAFTIALSSCFSITVNVYFPAKDVKSAFKELEDQLMKGGPAPAPNENAPAPAEPDGSNTEGSLGISFGPASAYAAGDLAAQLADRVKDDPKVVAAYGAMGGRLGYIDRLRDQGLVGDGNNGMLVPRGDLGKKEKAAVEQENDNRNDIIWAMARAIVEINGQPVTNDAISQVLDKASAEFAAVRRDKAKPGWWVQNADGSWVQK